MFPDGADRLNGAGLSVQVLGVSAFPVGDWNRCSRTLSRLSGIAASRYTVAWLARIGQVLLSE